MTCIKCGASMEQGFVMDKDDHGSIRQARWLQGKFESSIWTGAKTAGRDCYAVVSYRCLKCGFLEMYAKEPADVPGFFKA
ncbi:MAG: hypothetical protein JNL98_07025 [Bryobacterales bacterium]|nr:hypothetical protein [Bryobacterales bacterium]